MTSAVTGLSSQESAQPPLQCQLPVQMTCLSVSTRLSTLQPLWVVVHQVMITSIIWLNLLHLSDPWSMSPDPDALTYLPSKPTRNLLWHIRELRALPSLLTFTYLPNCVIGTLRYSSARLRDFVGHSSTWLCVYPLVFPQLVIAFVVYCRIENNAV